MSCLVPLQATVTTVAEQGGATAAFLPQDHPRRERNFWQAVQGKVWVTETVLEETRVQGSRGK